MQDELISQGPCCLGQQTITGSGQGPRVRWTHRALRLGMARARGGRGPRAKTQMKPVRGWNYFFFSFFSVVGAVFFSVFSGGGYAGKQYMWLFIYSNAAGYY